MVGEFFFTLFYINSVDKFCSVHITCIQPYVWVRQCCCSLLWCIHNATHNNLLSFSNTKLNQTVVHCFIIIILSVSLPKFFFFALMKFLLYSLYTLRFCIVWSSRHTTHKQCSYSVRRFSLYLLRACSVKYLHLWVLLFSVFCVVFISSSFHSRFIIIIYIYIFEIQHIYIAIAGYSLNAHGNIYTRTRAHLLTHTYNHLQ